MTNSEQLLLNYNVRNVITEKEFEGQGEGTLGIILKQYGYLAKLLSVRLVRGLEIIIGYPTDKRFGAECSWSGIIRIIPGMAGYFLHEYFHDLDNRSSKDRDQYKAMAAKLRDTKTMKEFFVEHPFVDGRTRAGKFRNYFSKDKEVLARFFNDFVILNYGDITEIPGYKLEFSKQEVMDHSEDFYKLLCGLQVYESD